MLDTFQFLSRKTSGLCLREDIPSSAFALIKMQKANWGAMILPSRQ